MDTVINHINKERNNRIKKLALIAENLYKEQKYIESYSIYKSIFRKYNEIRVLPNLVDIAFISTKKNLIKNRNLKFKLINLLINFGLSRENKSSLTNELIYLRLKLYREYKLYDDFLKLYNSIHQSLKNVIFVEFEFLHYSLETDSFSKAEITLEKLKKNKKDFYKNLDYFFIDKKTLNIVQNDNSLIDHNITFKKEIIQGDYNYIVVVSGTYEIFKSEIIGFINSLINCSTKFVLTVLIHDTSENEKNNIILELEKLSVKNYILIFESSSSLNLDLIATKSYYTARRYILVNDLMMQYNKPIYLFDADSLIRKDLEKFLKLNKDYDMSLHIKDELRYFQTAITANQSLFINTKNSKIFLNFYKNYITYIFKHKSLRWHIDQIVLYVSYILIKRFYGANINNNSDNNFKNKNSFFYHTFHNKYLL